MKWILMLFLVLDSLTKLAQNDAVKNDPNAGKKEKINKV